MSVASERSRGSRRSVGRYRTVARGSRVDSTLFGEPNKAAKEDLAYRRALLQRTGGRSVAQGSKGAAAASGRRGRAEAPAAGAPVVISASQLSTMRRRANIQSEEEALQRKHAAMDVKKGRAAVAEARKNRMLAMEARRRAAMPLTQLQKEEMQYRDRVRANATILQDEALDEVKQMQSYAEYAKTAMIRERQLAEKAERKAVEALAERIRDMESEIHRLSQLKAAHDKDQALIRGQRRAREAIQVQMAERAAAKSHVTAARVAEEEAMTALIKAQEEEDRAVSHAKELAKRTLREEVLAANEAALIAKKAAREAELAEDRRLFEYQSQKALEAEEAEADKEREAAMREFEFAKMRAAQKKVMDNRGAVDELRAKRAFEAAERATRQKEEALAARKAATLADIKADRERQMAAKQMQLALEVQREKEEFEENQRVQRAYIQAEEAQLAARHASNTSHRQALAGMVEGRRVAAKAAAEAERGSGKGFIQERDERMARVKRIRDEKVAELHAMGVAPKYTTQLARVDPMAAFLKDYKMGAQAGTKLRGQQGRY